MRAFAPEDLFAQQHARAIHQPVQMAESLECASDRGLPLFFAGHVRRDKACRRTQFGGDGLAGGCIDVGDDDLAAIGDQLARHGGAKTGVAAGDDKDFTWNLHIEFPKCEGQDFPCGTPFATPFLAMTTKAPGRAERARGESGDGFVGGVRLFLVAQDEPLQLAARSPGQLRHEFDFPRVGVG